MILTALSFLARVGVFIASVIVVGLGAKFIDNSAWNNDLLIYNEVFAAISILAAFVPPYPNFVYDLFWALGFLLAAIFALIIQFVESDCYGFRPHSEINCSTYKAGTAFAFLGALAWLASAFFGGLRILGVIFNIAQHTNRPLYIGGAEDEKEAKLADKEADRAARGLRDEDPEDLPQRKKKTIKGFGNSHVARYFVCYGILGVVLVAAGLPLLIMYAAPAFGQYLLDRIPIPDVNVTLLNPTNDSIQFSVFSSIIIPDTLTVNIEPTEASFFLPDTESNPIPFATVDLPKLTFPANEKISLVDQRLTLGNLDEFARLVSSVAYNPTFQVAGQAKTKVSFGGISTSVNLYKVVELPGFNNFPNIYIKEFGIQPADEQGRNVYGEVVVTNPAPATVTLGNVTLAVLVADIVLGEAFVAVDNIVPGNNTFVVRAKLNTEEIETNITDIVKAEIPYLQKELIMAEATGVSVVYEGQHLPYWEKAFQTIKVSATRPVKPILQMVVDSGASILTGNAASPLLGTMVGNLLDQILKTIKNLGDGDVNDYSVSLGGVARLILRLLTFLGLI